MANDNSNIQPASGENNQIVIYTTADGKVNLEVQIDANTVWLTQQQICLLYGKAKSTISEHLTHIFEEGELDPQVVVRENRTTTQHGAIEGKTQENITRFYNLDAILAVGFRVRSKQGTLFRQWAIERLTRGQPAAADRHIHLPHFRPSANRSADFRPHPSA